MGMGFASASNFASGASNGGTMAHGRSLIGFDGFNVTLDSHLKWGKEKRVAFLCRCKRTRFQALLELVVV